MERKHHPLNGSLSSPFDRRRQNTQRRFYLQREFLLGSSHILHPQSGQSGKLLCDCETQRAESSLHQRNEKYAREHPLRTDYSPAKCSGLK